jgi:hypothetical protein
MKSHGASPSKKRSLVDFQVFFQFTTCIHSGLLLISREARILLQLFSFAILHSKSIGRNFAMVFQDQFMNYPDVFFHSGGQGLP